MWGRRKGRLDRRGGHEDGGIWRKSAGGGVKNQAAELLMSIC